LSSPKKSPSYPQRDIDEFKTPEKRPQSRYHFLTLTDKCKAYLSAKERQTYTSIAKELDRDPKTIKKIVVKAASRRSLDNKNLKKDDIPKVLQSLMNSTRNSYSNGFKKESIVLLVTFGIIYSALRI